MLTDRIDAACCGPVLRAPRRRQRRGRLRQHRRRDRDRARRHGVQHPRRARRDHGRPRVLPDLGRGAPDCPTPRPTSDRAVAGFAISIPRRDVHGATLGVVGYGRIGHAVASSRQGFRHAGDAPRAPRHRRAGWVADLDDLLPRRPTSSACTCRCTDETRHLIDARRLGVMKPTAVLVNTARGPVVDEEALAAALEDGHHLRGRASTSTSANPRCTRGCSRPRTRCCSPTSATRPRRPAHGAARV